MPSSKWIFAANVPSDGPELSIAESLLSLNKVCLGVRRPVTFPLRLYDKDGCLIGLHLWWSQTSILRFAIFMKFDAMYKCGIYVIP